MSAVTKLQSPLKELVTGATQDGSAEFGKNEKDKKEVEEWIEKAAGGEFAKAEVLKASYLACSMSTDINTVILLLDPRSSARTKDVRREQLLHCCGCSIVWCIAPHSCE